MNSLQVIFTILANVTGLYATLCFIRCLCSWIPSINFSAFGQFLSAVCDPWMNLFRRLPLNFFGIDFSAMLSLGLLYLIQSVLESLAKTGIFQLSMILAYILMLVWSVLSTLLGLILIILIVRLCVMLFGHGSDYYGSIWTQLDSGLTKIVYRISNFFTGNRNVRYRTAIIISIIFILIGLSALYFSYRYLTVLIKLIPF